jgi:hypothetical protein
MKVKLTYFKESGKYYTEGSFTTKKHFYDVIVEVRDMMAEGRLPGLVLGAKEFDVLVEIPNAPPHMIHRVRQNAPPSLTGLFRQLASSRPKAKPGKCPRCSGTKKIMLQCHDPQCNDGTWDHYCKLGRERKCPVCKGSGKARKQA